MDSNLLSTKFILTGLVLIATFVLLVMGRISPELWEEICLIGLGVYSAANVTASAIAKK